MTQQPQNIPALRFPEFKDAPAWEFFSGNKIFENISNKEHNSDLPILAITQEFGAIPRDEINYNVIVTDKSVESYKVVEIGDFIISLRSFQGGIEYSNYKGICSPAYIILRKKTDAYDLFFKYYFKTDLFIQQLNKNIEGIRDGKMVSYKQFSELQLPFPSLAEQEKIAECLGSLDEWISAQSKKVEALEAHKKGLMQQLFPREGQTIPALRFDEFKENEEDWEEKTLGEVLIESKLGGNYENSENNKGIPVIKMGNIDRGIINTDKIQYLPIDNIYNTTDILQYGDLLFNTRNTLDLVGKVAIWRNELPFALYNSNLLKMTFNIKYISSNFFMNYIFNTESTLFKLKQIATGTTSVAAIYGKDLNNIKITFPSLAEQEKIAECLGSLDEWISAERSQLKLLQAHKKGLLQQLFVG